MRFCVLASSSQGNATYVEGGGVRLLIDAGISCRALEQSLAKREVPVEGLDGILVTHEHRDHIAGLYRFATKHRVPVFANEGTAAVIERLGRQDRLPIPEWAIFESRVPFTLGELVVQPVRISHDTAEPVAYTLACEEGKFGYFTDLGFPSQEVASAIQGCSALVLESNHDVEMLRYSGRPFRLVSRIAGDSGHLSNDQACDLMARACPETLRQLVLAHLSQDCNEPRRAAYQMQQVLKRLGREEVAERLAVAKVAEPLEMMEV